MNDEVGNGLGSQAQDNTLLAGLQTATSADQMHTRSIFESSLGAGIREPDRCPSETVNSNIKPAKNLEHPQSDAALDVPQIDTVVTMTKPDDAAAGCFSDGSFENQNRGAQPLELAGFKEKISLLIDDSMRLPHDMDSLESVPSCCLGHDAPAIQTTQSGANSSFTIAETLNTDSVELVEPEVSIKLQQIGKPVLDIDADGCNARANDVASASMVDADTEQSSRSNAIDGPVVTGTSARGLRSASRVGVSMEATPLNGILENSAHKDGHLKEPRQRYEIGESELVQEMTLISDGKVDLIGRENMVDGKTASTDLIGRAITKCFGKKPFRGTIASYDTLYNWFKVVYEDGDQEDLERAEVEALLLPLENSRTILLHMQQPSSGIFQERVLKKRKEYADANNDRKRFKSASAVLSSGPSGRRQTSEIDVVSKERRRSGTGLTLHEGIKRYLEKRENAGQSPIRKGTKRKATFKKIKTPKEKLLKFETTESSSTNKSTSKLTAGLSMPKNEGLVEPGAALVGSSMLKKFGTQFYSGSVMSYNEETRLYMVRYENGDEEKLEWRDLESTLSTRNKDIAAKPSTAKGLTKGRKAKAAEVHSGAALLGTGTRKKFGKKYYNGVVISYDMGTQCYKVKYEDGDMEELKWDKLQPTLVSEWQQCTLGNDTKKKLHCAGGQGNRKVLGRYARSKRGQLDADKNGAYCISNTVKKKFGKKFYPGKVVNYENKTKLYKVEYEDGDKEELEWHELEPILTVQCQPNTRPKNGVVTNLVKNDLGYWQKFSQVSEGRQVIPPKLKGRGSKTSEGRDAGSGSTLIGSSTRKKFGKKFYDGFVISFDPKTQFYKVRYEDGDEEDMEWCELKSTLIMKGTNHELSTSLALEWEEQNISVKASGVKQSISKSKNGDKIDAEGEAGVIGQSTRKRFGRKFYNGIVTGFNQRRKSYKVKYEDGDKEELEWSQLEPTLLVTEKHAKQFSLRSSRRGKTGSKQC